MRGRRGLSRERVVCVRVRRGLSRERALPWAARIERSFYMAVVHLNKENFEAEVLKSEVPVLVDFWAAWCGPCRMMAPVIEELAEEFAAAGAAGSAAGGVAGGAAVKVCKLDVDDSPEIAEQYGIESIPTLMVFKGGEVVKTAIGVQPKEVLKLMVLMA